MSAGETAGFVRRTQHRPPSGPAAVEVRARLLRFWRAVRRRLPGREEAIDTPRELDRPSTKALGRLVPSLDAAAGAEALAEALGGWLDGRADGLATRVIVAPPGSGGERMVAELAEARGLDRVQAPARDAVGDAPGALAEALGEAVGPGEPPRVLLDLERWLLRQDSAMPALRRLVERLATEGRWLIACHSWSWAWLARAVAAERLLGEPLVPKVWGAAELSAWLSKPFAGGRITCRERSSRERIFGGVEGASGYDREELSRWLMELAAMSRGVPEVAAALWNRALRTTPGAKGSEEDEEANDRHTYWVVPVHEAERDLPKGIGQRHRFVLHALLVHGGLERRLLTATLPLPGADVAGALLELEAAGVVVEGEAGMTVALEAMPATRDELMTGGYMTDGL